MSNKNNNPTGKGGFQEHPENRSTKGRGKKGAHLIKLIEEELAKIGTIKIGKKEVTTTYEDAFVRILIKDALKGDGQSRKLLMQYIIGMPKQMLELSGRLGVDETARLKASEMSDKEFKAYLQKHIDEIDRKASDSKQ